MLWRELSAHFRAFVGLTNPQAQPGALDVKALTDYGVAELLRY